MITARGGSKGIPRKNVRALAGKPLIAWTIEAALGSSYLDRVVVSSEDAEILRVARQWGADAPFIRPERLAQDDSTSMDVVFHTLDELPGYDALLLLQPTSPLRSTSDIDACLALAAAHEFKPVVSVTPARERPHWMYRIETDGTIRPILDASSASQRQGLPSVHVLNGALYFGTVQWLRARKTFVTPETLAYVMPHERSVDVDDTRDWETAEAIIVAGRNRTSATRGRET